MPSPAPYGSILYMFNYMVLYGCSPMMIPSLISFHLVLYGQSSDTVLMYWVYHPVSSNVASWNMPTIDEVV